MPVEDAGVDPGGLDADEHLVVLDGGDGQFGQLQAAVGSVHHGFHGYWNTSSKETLKTRAIWNAISSDGE